MEWYDPVHDGIVALTSGDGTFRVAGRTNFGIFDVSMNDNGHYLLATWEIDAQGAITAYLHIIDSVELTENGLLAYVADVTPGSSADQKKTCEKTDPNPSVWRVLHDS